jgi:hypothetical protein
MSDQSKLGIGKLIETEQHRDAIHVAVAPVVAGMPLRPGEHVTINGGRATLGGNPSGIVDPFLLDRIIPEGATFWLFLYPGSITSLRHEWTHPAFAEQVVIDPPPQTSEGWLRTYAASIPLSFEELMEAAEQFLLYDEYLVHGGRYEGMSLPDEFWNHYQVVTGEAVPESKQSSFFSCSC